MARLCPLFSGSSGNSVYIGSGGTGILIDIGRSAKQIENVLVSNDLDASSIKAIFLTHEHIDHVKGLRVFASKYGIKVYGSQGTISFLEKNGTLNGKFPYEVLDKNKAKIDNMVISQFRTSHDCNESVGYVINTSDDRKIAIATDLGFMSDDVRSALIGCDTIILESNHDIRMLQNGNYPYYLKRRILSKTGHLSNDACSNELPFLVKNGTTRFILAHLSSENNIPELAYQTAVMTLTNSGFQQGIDFELFIAPKENFGIKTLVF